MARRVRRPLEVIGLVDELDPLDHTGDVIGLPWVVPCHDINPPSLLDGFADKVSRTINDPKRGAGLLLLPQRDWPENVYSAGMVETLAVDEAERIAINARLGVRGMRKNQARLYMPQQDALPDVTGDIVPGRVAAAISVGIDQLLVGRQATALPERWRNDPAAQEWWTSNPFNLPQIESEDPRAHDVARAEQELREARRQITILRQQKTATDSRLSQLLDENRQLREQLDARADPGNLQAQLAAMQDELDRYAAAYDEIESERDSLRRRIGEHLAARLSQADGREHPVADEPTAGAPLSSRASRTCSTKHGQPCRA